MIHHEDFLRRPAEGRVVARLGLQQGSDRAPHRTWRRWSRVAIWGLAVLFPFATAWSQQAQFVSSAEMTAVDATAEELENTEANAVRREILELLKKTYSKDGDTVDSAVAKLAQFGVKGSQLEFGRKLVHPDPYERRLLVQNLSQLDVETSSDLLFQLLSDDDASVRVATLEQIGRLKPTPEMESRIMAMAQHDPDPRVQGYARLISAEWNLTGHRPTSRKEPTKMSKQVVVPVAATAPERTVPEMSSRVERLGRGDLPPPVETAAPVSGDARQLFHESSLDLNQNESPAVQQILVKKSWAKGLIADNGTLIRAVVPVNAEQESPFVLPPEPVPAFDEAELGLDDFEPGDLEERASGLTEGEESEEFLLDEVGPRLNLNSDGSPRPEVLQRPLGSPELPDPAQFDQVFDPNYQVELPAPLGFTGPSSVIPSESQSSAHFVPVEDRWRIGVPEWDRYGKGHPQIADYPFVKGHWWDPYNQNVLKGDYPIMGQHTFMNFTATSQTLAEIRALPTPTTPFESTKQPHQEEFFGDPNQFFMNQNYRFTFDLIHGNTAFKPVDWQLRMTPVFNMNYLDVEELGIVNPNVNAGTTRFRTDVALEEYFVEAKLADLGPEYDFVSARAGNQFFASDFRGFVFSDTNRAVRLFGTQFSNRDQFNLLFLDQVEKDTNSLLNTFNDRHQNTVIANYYRQDFIYPGYTAQMSFHYNNEQPSMEFDKNDFLVRPDPVGIYQEHQVDAYYFGFAGDGHIGRFNISNAAYWVVGRDSLNPLAGRPQDINAQMVALEVSYDRDWMRFRSSFFWASGDDDISDDRATGFDTILDNPGFAGGEFSFWQRQAIKLFGVNLVQRNSLVPDLRSSKFQGQSNFVNPGLFLVNGGVDMDITPKLRLIGNANFLWFDHTQVLQQFVFQDDISKSIGTDISLGMEYRPLLTNNVIIVAGLSGFFPESGFEDLYNPFRDGGVDPLYSHFVEVNLTY